MSAGRRLLQCSLRGGHHEPKPGLKGGACWGSMMSLQDESRPWKKPVQTQEGGPSFGFMVTSPLERLVSMSGMVDASGGLHHYCLNCKWIECR